MNYPSIVILERRTKDLGANCEILRSTLRMTRHAKESCCPYCSTYLNLVRYENGFFIDKCMKRGVCVWSKATAAKANRLLIPAFTTLAFWQLRRTWFLLLFITLGMIAAIVIASAIPLLSNVMLTAGLRNTLRATPDSADIQLLTQANGISTPVAQKIHDQFDPLFHRYLGNTIKPDLSAILSEDFSFVSSTKTYIAHHLRHFNATGCPSSSCDTGPICSNEQHPIECHRNYDDS